MLLTIFLVLQLGRAWIFFSYENNDRNRQVQQAVQWERSGTLSLRTLDPTDYAQEISAPPYPWPPAYPILLGMIYALTQDWFLAVETMHILSLLVTLSGIAYGWYQLTPPTFNWLGVGWCIGWGLNFSPFTYLGTTDVLAGGCWLWSMISVWRASFQLSQRQFWWELLHVLAISLAIWLRYAYLPLALVSIYILARIWLHSRSKRYIWQVLVILANMMGVWGYQQWVAGPSSIALEETTKLIHVDHLLEMDPFLVKGLWYIAAHKLAILFAAPESWFTIGLWIGSLLIGTWLLKAWNLARPPIPAVIRYLLWGAGATVGLLLALSLFIPAEVWGDGTVWTYVSETRYYFPVALFVLVSVWYFIHQIPAKSRFFQVTVIGLIVGGLVATGHSVSRWHELWMRGETRNGRFSEFAADLKWTYQFVEAKRQEGSPVRFIHGSWYVYAEEQTIAQWAGALSQSLDETMSKPIPLSDTVLLICNLKPDELTLFYSKIDELIVGQPDTVAGRLINQHPIVTLKIAPSQWLK